MRHSSGRQTGHSCSSPWWLLGLTIAVTCALIQGCGTEEARKVLIGVEMCGPVDKAIEFLKPTDPMALSEWTTTQAEHLRLNPLSEEVLFYRWNEIVPLPKDSLIILRTEVDLVKQVVVVNNKFDSRSIFESWYQQLTVKNGDPDAEAGDHNRSVRYVWNQPGGVKVELAYDETRTLTGMSFTCTEMVPEGMDLF